MAGGGLRGAITVRATLLVVGVFLLQLAFVASYVGALHSPTPHRVPVAVAASGNAAEGPGAARTLRGVIHGLNTLPGDPIDASSARSARAARHRIDDRDVDAALVVDTTGRTDRLLVAGAGGPALASATEHTITKAWQAKHRGLRTVDIRPVGAQDADGLSSFYLVVGWIVGGYLVAAILGISAGMRPANRARVLVRLGALAVYAIASGLGGALLIDSWLHALTGAFVELWWLGALVVFAAAAATTACEMIAGIVGIGVAILLFVVLGNPSSGGPYPRPLLPVLWRSIGPYLPTGAGVQATRSMVYFDGAATGGPLVALGAWALAGVLCAVLVATLRPPAETGASRPA